MIKSYTDLEQSKKLAEILPIESADMFIIFAGDREIIRINDNIKDYNKWDTTPVWSLSALLDVIPKCIKGYNVLRIDIGEKDFSMWYDEVGCGVNSDLPDITMEEPIDACYEMIIHLHSNQLL